MATFTKRPVIGDTGSQELAQLRKNYNALLDVLGDLITGLKTVTTLPGDINTLATTVETALQATVEKIISQKDLPLNPERPALQPGTLYPP